MKNLSVLLALYFLSLTAVPCMDRDGEVKDNHEQTVSISQERSGHSHDHQDTADGCSPFCLCHCCHTHVFITHELALFSPIIPIEFTDITPRFKDVDIFDFLIPPKA